MWEIYFKSILIIFISDIIYLVDLIKQPLEYNFLNISKAMAGVVRFELTNDRVRADCLTTWRYPKILKLHSNFK